MDPILDFPPGSGDVDYRLSKILLNDVADRLVALEVLVSLQETELCILWCMVIGLGALLVKEHYGK